MSLQRSPAPSPVASIQPTDRPGFRSFKTRSPVHYPQRWHRDLLIQATLDPAIEAIEPHLLAQDRQASFKVFVWFGEKRFLVIAQRETVPVQNFGPTSDTLIVERAFVLGEPRCSVARTIWASRTVAVSPGDRIRLLRKLYDHPSGLSLERLMEGVRSETADPAEVVLSLVCSGQAEIETRSHLSPDTLVRLRATFRPPEEKQSRLASL